MDTSGLIFESVTEEPVVNWNLGIEGNVLVRYDNNEPYRILNVSDANVTTVETSLSVRELSNQDVMSNAQLIELDW